MYATRNGWADEARAWLGTVSGRITYAVTTDDGVLAAEMLPLGATIGDAGLQVILAMRSADKKLWNFATNNAPLAEAMAGDETLAGPHVGVIDLAACPAGDPVMVAAKQAAEATAADLPKVYLRAATDGALGKPRRLDPRKTASAHDAYVAGLAARGGYGWVTAEGKHGYGPLPKCSCPLEAELVAVEKLLDATAAHTPLHIEMDSTAAIKLIRACLAGEQYPTSTRSTGPILDRIRRHMGRDIQVSHVKGHQDADGSPVDARAALNVAADRLAFLGREGLVRNDGDPARVEARAHETAQWAVETIGEHKTAPEHKRRKAASAA